MGHKRYPLEVLIATAIGSFSLAGLIFHASIDPPVMADIPGAGDLRPASFSAIAKRTMPVVVNISTTTQKAGRTGSGGNLGGLDPLEDFFNRFFGDAGPRETPQRSLGSGIVISKDGEILTNYHVVRNADAIRVKLADQTEHEAKLVGKDEKTDLALIKIATKGVSGLPAARWGDSGNLEVGDWVVAIGNPFGLELTVTAGIVSAKGRVIGAGPYDRFIQTDASINPGNSGGPLINMQGEVVGINSAIFSQSGGNVGIGFAIPVDLARKVVEQLRKNGRVVRGWMGIRVQEMSAQQASSLGLTRGGVAALVNEVAENSPAAEAGIKPGDVILEFNGKPLPRSYDLPSLVADTPPGQKVALKILRDRSERTVAVRITEPAEEREILSQADGREGELGLRVQKVTPELSRLYGLSGTKGVIVVEVQPGSPADQAGIEVGDVVREVNQRPVNTAKDFEQSVRLSKRGDRLMLLVQRGDNTVFFALKRKG